MTHDADIVIAGGGLNGCALALALAGSGSGSRSGSGLRIALVDSRPVETRADPGFDGRSYALAVASRNVLSALGLWSGLEHRAQPILEVKASDGRAGEGAAPQFLHFHHGELDDGPMGHMIEDRFLRAALLDALAGAGVTHLAGQSVTGQEVDAQGVNVALGSGEILRTRLLVGCDGRDSGVAARAGIRRVGWDYGQTALVCAVEHERAHHGIAHQFFMPAGPLAILPLPGNRSSIVWSLDRDSAEMINALDDAGYLDALRPAFGDFLGEITLAGARFAYPLSLSLAQRFVTERVALLGDAAHGLHPIAGQGLNFGLRDMAALAEVVITAARRGEDIASPLVLARYQQWRRFDTTLMALGTDMVNRLFSNDNPLLRGVRDIGMGIVSATPALRQRFMREAAGVTGDLPRLARGVPI